MFFIPFLKKRRYYLDYAAATPVDKRIVHAMHKYWSLVYANPFSIHTSGIKVRDILEKQKSIVRDISHARKDTGVVFTSGGTESNQRTIDYGISMWKKESPGQPYSIIISSIEHPSIYNYLNEMLDPLLTVHTVMVNSKGSIILDNVQELLDQAINPVLISVSFQSGEVGTTQPIRQLSQLINEYRASRATQYPLVQCDMSQGVLYHTINFDELGVDFLTLCSQKYFGPKGTGTIISKKTYDIARDGTPTVPLIVGQVIALGIVQTHTALASEKIVALRKQLVQQLDIQNVSYLINGDPDERSSIINLSFPDCRQDSEELVVAFDNVGLQVSSKSACMGNQAQDSQVLSAMGVHPKNSIRISLIPSLSTKDINEISTRIAQVVNK